jgi:hypothetical protein
MRWMTLGGSIMLAAGLAACGPALDQLGEEFGVTARDAFLEARTRAVTWDADARLRWMEGENLTGAGLALAGEGTWRLHYTAPGRTQGLVVTVTSLESGAEERPPTPPPGVAVGDRALDETWLNSPEALARLLEVRAGSVPDQVHMTLVPTRPAQWVVRVPDDARTWRVDARTGEVLTP